MIESRIDAIKSRSSVRTFYPASLSDQDKAAVKHLLEAGRRGPFGGSIRLVLLDLSALDKAALKSMGTYGIIRNAPLYIGAVVTPAPRIFVDLGFIFETCILELTAAGFGTCWMAGTFSRAGFAAQANLVGNEVLAAICPVGRAHAKRSFTDNLIRAIAGSGNRKPWKELFFSDTDASPLTAQDAGAFAVPLECVRIAPSASNKQPWRLIKKGAAVHFFLERKKGIDKLFRHIDIQAMDMGIALCHFEIAAKECGISGSWKCLDPGLNQEKWGYIISFD